MTGRGSSSAPPEIVVVGSINVDVLMRARRFPREGETLSGATVVDALGGKGANQAVAAARLGASVAMVACVGDDAVGRHALETLAAEGVDVRHCRVTDEGATGRAAIVVDDEGRNTIVVADGANALLGPDDVARADELLAGARVVLGQLEVPIATVGAALAAARAHGALGVLNAAPALPLDGLSAGPDVLVANRVEARQLSGAGDAPDDAPAARLARDLRRARRARVVVVTDGEHGAVALDDAGEHRAAALAVDARDTVGAGDAFVGALVAELASGADLSRALRRGCAAGSLATRRTGAQPSLPTRTELDAALAPPAP